MMTLTSPHLDERTERLHEIMNGVDLPTLEELDMLAQALDIDVEELRALCLFDEFSVIEKRWDVTPQRLAEIAERYGLERAAEARGVAIERGPAKVT